MIALLFLPFAMAAAVTDIDAKLGYLAEDELVIFMPTRDDVLEDADVRAEILRVGFPVGCDLISDKAQEVSGRNSAAMTPKLIASINKVVPRKTLTNARYLSFVIPPLDKYTVKVRKDFNKHAATEIAASRNEMLASTKAALAQTGSASDAKVNVIYPKPQTASALGITGPWDFTKASHMALACAAQRLGPDTPPSEGGAE